MGCTSFKKSSNFTFDDGNNIYKNTSADSQLVMRFNNLEIVTDEWGVVYAEDAYIIFYDIANKLYGEIDISDEIIESYSWSILKNGTEVELFSGFNNFYGVGPKLKRELREPRINRLCEKYQDIVELDLNILKDKLNFFLMKTPRSFDERLRKAELRVEIKEFILESKNSKLIEDVIKLIYRLKDEIYISIPDSKKFHKEHPNFFDDHFAELELYKNRNETKKVLLSSKKGHLL